MGLGRVIRRKVRAVAAPAVFLSLVAYCGWNAVQGDHGLQAFARRQEQLKAMQAELVRVQAEQQVWERRVAGLRVQRLDPDMLDERARAMLNVADPGDLVMLYGPGRRLF